MKSWLDRCIFNATSTGTVDFVVASAVTGYLTPAQSGAKDQAIYHYAAQIVDGSGNVTAWEVGTGVYTVSTVTLTRVPEFSSNSNNKVNFATPPQVMITVLSADFDYRILNILDYGGISDGTGDNGPAVTAALNMLDLSRGGKLIFPEGVYNFNTAGEIPAFVDPAIVEIEMYGATLSTTAAISILNRMPTDQTNANNLVGARFAFRGGLFQGNNTAGQKGIFLGASYTSILEGVGFYNFDVGFNGAFALQTHLNSIRGFENSTAFIKLETGVGYWTGATINNSQCNVCVIQSCRDYCKLGQTASYMLLASDGCIIKDSISEGNSPTNNILFDDQTASTVKDFDVIDFHSENTPSNAIIALVGAGGGNYSFEDIFNGGVGGFLVDSSGIGNCNIQLINTTLAYANALKPAGGQAWTINGWGDGTLDITSSTFWVGGVSPTTLIGEGREPSGNGMQFFSKHLFLGTTNLLATDAFGITPQGNIIYATDDTYYIGFWQGADPLFGARRPKAISVGTGGIYNRAPYRSYVSVDITSGVDNAQFYDTSTIAAGMGGIAEFGGYYTGTTPTLWSAIQGYKVNGTDGNFAGGLRFYTRANGSGLWTTSNYKAEIDDKGNFVIGNAALATGATDGFIYIPTCAGTPTGVPTDFTGRIPLIYDTTNNLFYMYDGSSWISLLSANITNNITTGYTVTPGNGGTLTTGQTFTATAVNGNYQYYTNNGAHTFANPSADCAIDVLVTNATNAGAITFSTFTVGSTGDALTTTNGNKFIISTRRINAVSTYLVKALQ